MGITIRNALKLPVLSGVRVVAGETQLDREITSVNLMEVPDISEYVRPGELLITTLYSVYGNKAVQQTLIPMLVEKGVSALAVAPYESGREIPEVILNAAMAHDFPLLSLPYRISFNDIIEEVMQAILDDQVRLLRKNAEIHSRFFNILLNGGSLSEIAEMLYTESGLPVAIYSALGTVLASAGDGNIHMLENSQAYLCDREEHLVVQGEDGREFSVLAYPVEYGGKRYATVAICQAQETAGRAEKLSMERDSVQQVANIISLEIVRLQQKFLYEQRFRSTLIDNILQGRISSLSKILSTGQQYGWDLSGAFFPAVMQIREDLFEKNGGNTRQIDISLQQSLDEFTRRYPDLRVIIADNGNHTIALFPAGKPEQAEKIKGYLTRVLEAYQSQLRYPVWIGLGRRIETILELATGAAQAEQAMRLAQQTEETQHVVRYDALGAYRILMDNCGDMEKRLFCQDVLGDILRQKPEYRQELLSTLRMYFACCCSLRLAAKALYIHHNTIGYRIARIEELTGRNTRDASDRLDFQIALKLLDLYPM